LSPVAVHVQIAY